jgi:hypothetical protein
MLSQIRLKASREKLCQDKHPRPAAPLLWRADAHCRDLPGWRYTPRAPFAINGGDQD